MLSSLRFALLAAAALPFAAATDCSSGSFFFASKSTCVPTNGHLSSDATSAPSGCSCPSTAGDWYYSKSKQICTPSNPTYTDTCPAGSEWSSSHTACIKSIPAQTSSQCMSAEFWWSERSSCLPSGTTATPIPPSGSKCPSSGWGWNSRFGSCVPLSQPSSQPTCSGGWGWISDIYQCQPSSTAKRGSSMPAPSGYANPVPNSYAKRSLRSRAKSACPKDLNECPIAGATGLLSDTECLDTAVELTSCGGCASTGEGQDCTAIAGAHSVECARGACVVHTCNAGFTRSADGASCSRI